MTTPATHAASTGADAALGDASASKAGRAGAGRDRASFERAIGRAERRERAQESSQPTNERGEARRSDDQGRANDAERSSEQRPGDDRGENVERERAARHPQHREATDERAAPTTAQLDAAALSAALAHRAGGAADLPATDVLKQLQLALQPGDGAPASAIGIPAPSTPPTSALERLAHARVEPTAAGAAEPAAFEIVEPDSLPMTAVERSAPSTHDGARSDTAPDARAGQVEPTKSAPAAKLEPAAPPLPLARVEELAEQRAGDILRQVRLSLQPAERHATIQLDPPELGRIAIRLVVRKGRVDAELRVEERGTLDVLARHVPELRATLERSGLHSGSFDLQMGFRDERGETAHQQRGSRAPREIEIQAPAALRGALATHLDHDAAVDTYA